MTANGLNAAFPDRPLPAAGKNVRPVSPITGMAGH